MSSAMSSIAIITILLLVLQVSNVYAFHLNNALLRVPTGRKASIVSGTSTTMSQYKYQYQSIMRHRVSCLKYSVGNNEEGDDDDVMDKEEEEEEEDWRTFRARLVSGEAQSQNTHGQLPVLFHEECDLEQKGPSCDNDDDETNTKNTSFLYESGSVVEQGTLILHRPPIATATTTKHGSEEDDAILVGGYGLGRQFLHKSVILILEHSNKVNGQTPTRGVILNRPTDLKLYDHPSNHHEEEDEETITTMRRQGGRSNRNLPQIEWNVRYGGEDSDIQNDHPKFYCLHSVLPNTAPVPKTSREVMNGIYFTSFQNAQELVRKGFATSNDFWVFCGFVSWDNGELRDEIERGIWHAISTDSHTVKKGLRILGAGDKANIEDCGVRTWSMLMNTLGKGALIDSISKEPFDDLMLKVWSKRNLVFKEPPKFLRNKVNSISDRSKSTLKDEIVPGTIIRGSVKDAPFLLSDQEYHKSLILIIQNDGISTGILLNHPSTRSFDLSFQENHSFFQQQLNVCFPLRFGGTYGDQIEGSSESIDQPMFFLHMNDELKQKHIGEPVGESVPNGIWKCSMEEVIDTISTGIATAEDFLVIDGICIWSQEVDDEGSTVGGIGEQIINENFEVVQQAKVTSVWDLLKRQSILTPSTLDFNLNISHSAWSIAAANVCEKETPRYPFFWDIGAFSSSKNDTGKEVDSTSILSDDALKTWIMAYLLY